MEEAKGVAEAMAADEAPQKRRQAASEVAVAQDLKRQRPEEAPPAVSKV